MNRQLQAVRHLLKLQSRLIGFAGLLMLLIGARAQAANYTGDMGFRETHTLAVGGSDYVNVAIPVDHTDGWRIVGFASANLDLSLIDIATGTTVISATGTNSVTLFIPPEDIQAGTTYQIRIHSNTGADYDVGGDPVYIRDLPWEPGDAVPTQVATAPVTPGGIVGGDVLYRLTMHTAVHGAVRMALDTAAGSAEVDLYTQSPNVTPTNVIPRTNNYRYYSANPGDDGFVFDSTNYNDNETWMVRVHQTDSGLQKTANWTLYAGDIHVVDLGTLADTEATPGLQTVGPEGMVFYRTSVDAATIAWQLWLRGSAGGDDNLDLLVGQGSAPTQNGGTFYDWKRHRQTLVTSPLLTSDTYYVGVPAPAGTTIDLVSKKQPITDISFATTSQAINEPAGEFGFQTFRVDVPVDQIAWQVNLTSTGSANADLYVRKGAVPNSHFNDALSEAAGDIIDSTMIVPPTLTNGAWYITVASDTSIGSGAGSISSGDVPVTDICFLNPQETGKPCTVSTPSANVGANGQIVNDATTQAGWRIFRVPASTVDPEQLPSLGWELQLAAQAANTRLAIRRNYVPGARYYRNGNDTVYQAFTDDANSDTGRLQRPNHQADIWYIGIFTPSAALGPVELTTSSYAPPTVGFNGGTATMSNQDPKYVQYYRIDVPADALGWYLDLTNVSGGDPQIVVRRDELPPADKNYNGLTSNNGDYYYDSLTNKDHWDSGKVVVAGSQWTGYDRDSQNTRNTNDERLVLGMNSPLQPGTYYVAVQAGNASQTRPLSYTLRSRGIGDSCGGAVCTIAVSTLAFGGSAAGTIDTPSDIAVYKMDVPTTATSIAMHLEATSGEVQLAMGHGALPNITKNAASDDPGNPSGTWRHQSGDDYFYKYATENKPISTGTYYAVVISAGANPSGSIIGTGAVSYTLNSLGEQSIDDRTATPVTSDQPLSIVGESLTYGTQKVYRFRIPTGTSSMEVRLLNSTGAPKMDLRVDPEGQGLIPKGGVNQEGGAQSNVGIDSALINVSEPAGDYTLVVDADNSLDATYDVQVVVHNEQVVNFNGGTLTKTGQDPATVEYYRIDVPSDAVGWYLDLTNVSGGDPSIVVRRDQLPPADRNYNGLTSNNGNYSYDSLTNKDHWDSGKIVVAGSQWTGYNRDPQNTRNTNDERLVLGMNSPLQPGTYYVAVQAASLNETRPLNYTIRSRGIGDSCGGAACAIPVSTLTFGGSAAGTIDTPSDIAVYKMDVPTTAKSIAMHLEATSGEVQLAMGHGAMPNITKNAASDDPGNPSGTWRHQPGDDYFYKYATESKPISTGTYYAVVISAGANPSGQVIGSGAVSYTLNSLGEQSTDDRTATPITTAAPLNITGQSLAYGAQKVYRFRVPAGTSLMDVRLNNRVGDPKMSLRVDPVGQGNIPAATGGRSNIASEGGFGANRSDPSLITLTQPAGDYTLTVFADSEDGQVTAANYDLDVSVVDVHTVDFNNGSFTTTSQDPSTIQYFKVVVPDDAVGWFLDLTNVSGGDPSIVIRRDQLPPADRNYNGLGNNNGDYNYDSLFTHDHWDSGKLIATTSNWSGFSYYPGSNRYASDESFVLGMNSPLQPGTYYVAVQSGNIYVTDPMTYTLRSRGIGDSCGGSACTIGVSNLAFGGTASGSIANPGDIAVYRMSVPQNTPSLAMNLVAVTGEVQLAMNYGAMPNSTTPKDSHSLDDPNNRRGVARIQAGSEYLYEYPRNPNSVVSAGDYYAVVISGGVGPVSTTYGTGAVSYELHSLGAQPIDDHSDTPVTPTAPLVISGQDLDYGQEKVYRFVVPDGVPAARIRFLNKVGNPGMVIHRALDGETPRISDDNGPYNDYHAAGGGYSAYAKTNTLTTLIRPGTYTVVVYAGISSGEAAAQYDLEVTGLAATPLKFDGGSAAGSLLDGERRFYRVGVPEFVDGVPLGGWRVTAKATSGIVKIRLKKGSLPGYDGGDTSLPAYGNEQTILTPADLTPGDWFIEVEGTGLTDFTLASAPVRADTTFTMPANPNVVFGDTGASLGGDGGRDLEQNHWDYYKVIVPEGNGGLLRTVVDAISGDPELYIRRELPPTTDVSGAYDRQDQNNGTLYDNWVGLADPNTPADGELTPGTWWIGIRANGSNARYRLKLSTGSVTTLQRDGGSVANQTLAAGDVRYYRFDVPQTTSDPTTSTISDWQVTLSSTSGQVVGWVRAALPPGASGGPIPLAQAGACGGSNLVDWCSDRHSGETTSYPKVVAGQTTTLNIPGVQPGRPMYIGVHALTDAQFSLASQVGTQRLAIDGVVDFENGQINVDLPANGKAIYRVDAPANAQVLAFGVTASSSVKTLLQRDTLPDASPMVSYTGSPNIYYSMTDRYGIQNNDRRFRPGHSYYLVLENTGSSQQTVSVQAKGLLSTSDSDADGLPDAEEMYYFGSLGYDASGDQDNDGYTNLEEITAGSDPNDHDSTPLSYGSRIGIRSAVKYGDESSGHAYVKVERMFDQHGPVSVDYAVTGVSATSGVDFEPVTGTLTWASRDKAPKVIRIPVIDDAVIEQTEYARVTLSNVQGDGKLARSTALVAIADNDDTARKGTIEFADQYPVIEEQTGQVSLSVQRVGGSLGAVSGYVKVTARAVASSVGLHAKLYEDFDLGDYPVSWADGETGPRTITVNLRDNGAKGGVRVVDLIMHDVKGAENTSARSNALLLLDNDASPEPARLVVLNPVAFASESTGSAQIEVMRFGTSSGAIDANWSTSDGTALSNADYVASNGTLHWADGDTTNKFITVPIVDDATTEPREFFNVLLQPPAQGAILDQPVDASGANLIRVEVADDDDDGVDTDGDGLVDLIDEDWDNDGMRDFDETLYGLDPTMDDSSLDADGDGFTNSQELAQGTSPIDAIEFLGALDDFDNDHTQNYADPDDDNDGLTDAEELANGLNPYDASDAQQDPDGDGVTSYYEVKGGSNPLDASSIAFTGLIEAESSFVEVSEGSTPAVVRMQRLISALGDVTVHVHSEDLSAVAGTDYSPIDWNIAWSNGNMADQNIVFYITDNNHPDGPRYFAIDIDTVSGGAVIGTRRVIVSIKDNDIDDPTGTFAGFLGVQSRYLQVSEATNVIYVNVYRRGGLANVPTASVQWELVAGGTHASDPPAVTDADLNLKQSGTLTWSSNENTQSAYFYVNHDQIPEGTESLTLRLFNPSDGAVIESATTTIAIMDDDSTPDAGYVVPALVEQSGVETDGNLSISLLRLGGSTGQVSATLQTQDLGNDTAAANADYTPVNATVTWADGDMRAKTVTVPVINDSVQEGIESFGYKLTVDGQSDPVLGRELIVEDPSDVDVTTDTDGDGTPDYFDLDDDNDGVPDWIDQVPLDPTETIDTDGDGIGNNADTDDDNDGVPDTQDAFPLDPTESVDTDGDGIGNNADTDDDNDGVLDDVDAFPLDATESVDTDGDGVGNNADTDDDNDGVADVDDAFPLDATESVDTDGDGIGNNADTDDDNDGVADVDDAFPLDANESVDTDGDGIGNNADPDDDNDGVADTLDAFPLDATESVDTDGDGIGNNADTDDDNDGVADTLDAFPLDASESVDTDGDGIGNNADTDDDNDGVADTMDAFPLDASESVDTDGDGIGNNADTDDDNDGVADNLDAFPLDASESVDTDGDGIGNNADTDDDNDGVADVDDAFPLDPAESVDTDGDGIGNNADTDDDGDGHADTVDAFPLDASEWADADGDGIGDNADPDDDNDGVADNLDAFPFDPAESVDTDGDGIGNNADLDDDNDGVLDTADAFPLDASESVDTDGDGIGNNADTDDDNDGVADVDDAFPLDPNESADFDHDGIGDNADTDDDNDGVPDLEDAFPLNAAESVDTDHDGIGNNADTDDDNDGYADTVDVFPLDPTEWADADGDGIGDNADPDDDNDGVPDAQDANPLDPSVGAFVPLASIPDTYVDVTGPSAIAEPDFSMAYGHGDTHHFAADHTGTLATANWSAPFTWQVDSNGVLHIDYTNVPESLTYPYASTLVSLGIASQQAVDQFVVAHGDIQVELAFRQTSADWKLMQDNAIRDEFLQFGTNSYRITSDAYRTELLGSIDAGPVTLNDDSHPATELDPAAATTSAFNVAAPVHYTLWMALPAGNYVRQLDLASDGSGTVSPDGLAVQWREATNGDLVVTDPASGAVNRFTIYRTYTEGMAVLTEASFADGTLAASYGYGFAGMGNANISGLVDTFLISSFTLTEPGYRDADGNVDLSNVFGFKLQQDGRAIKVLDAWPTGTGPSVATTNFWSQDTTTGEITLEGRWDTTANVYDADCDTANSDCVVYRVRHWQPILVTTSRLYVVEWDEMSTTFNPADMQLQVDIPARLNFYQVFSQDQDGDNAPDIVEVFAGTDPFTAGVDTDGDGIIDAFDTDDDGDGIPDSVEIGYGLDPLVNNCTTDSDNDGYDDCTEYQHGSSPIDASSAPDLEAPVLSIPVAPVVEIASGPGDGVSASNALIADWLASVSATDNIDGTLPVGNDAPAFFPLGSTTVTFDTADQAGNVATATATITVIDNRPQQLVTSWDTMTVAPGAHLALPVTYTTSDNNPELTGVLVRIHFNSSRLTWTGFSNVFATSKTAEDVAPQSDVNDLDHNPDTDSYVAIAWADLGGTWPGSLPQDLFTVDFDVASTFPLGEATTVDFSSDETASGYAFRGSPVQVITGLTLDVDGDGQAKALSDGLLVLRHEFGFSGATLYNGAVAPGAARSEAEMDNYLAQAETGTLDIDANGRVNALTDGLLVLRRLFGFSGATLVKGAVASDCSRCDATAIAKQIDDLAP